ncbi:MAG: FAD:protein FMN transferase [Hyphomicrobiales bacterium]|nr:FAD:protein FMN transferase [Hyphomicrobiales bacterium]
MALTRREFLAGAGAALTATRVSAAAPDLLQIKGPAFGASWRVRVAAGADAHAIVRAVTGVVGSVDAAMSPFRATSEISVFNRAETTDWLPLSSPTLSTLEEAKRIAAQTRGAFDPTLGGLVGQYGFGPITQAPEGSFRDLEIGRGHARKAHSRQTLDLCGIGKGHALDRCAQALRSIGLYPFFMELGGETYATGANPGGRPWRAGVESPLPRPETPYCCIVTLAEEALATSGDRVNSYVLSGHRYSHIIDPRRMRPADGALASVSVLAPRAITADALATALFAMGSEDGPQFAERTGIAALFISRDGYSLREVMTGGFSSRIAQG